MSKSHFYTVLFVLLPLLYYLSLPITVGDLAGWTAYGTYFWETGRLMTADIYSVLETRPLVYPALLPIVYGIVDAAGGLALVSLFHKLALIVLLWLIYKKSLGKLEDPWTLHNLPWIAIALNGLSIYFIDRPAVIALIPLLLSYDLIEKEERFDGRFFFRMAAVMVVWVNIHGSWPLLLIMLGWKFLFVTNARNLIRNASVLAGLCVVTLLNPFGAEIWPYIIETGSISKARLIDEWNVTNFHEFFPQGIIFYMTAIALAVFVMSKKKKAALSSPLIPLWILGFTAFRNIGLFSVVLLPFLGNFGWLRSGEVRNGAPRALNVVIVGALVFVCLMFTPYLKHHLSDYIPSPKNQVYDEFYQAEFAGYIRKSGSKGPILNDWDYGSYLLYSLPNKILIDARNVIYHEVDFQKYLSVMNGDDSWADYAAKYNFDFIMVPTRRRHLLIEKIKRNSDWKLALQNSETTLFQKVTVSRP